MNTPESLYKIAEDLLFAAEHEQARSVEDVVTHLICTNSRQSISNYLSGYLIQKNIPIDQPESLESLHMQCQSVDPRFEGLDFGKINCRFETHDRYYCLEYEHVDACLKVANQVRSIVLAETPGY